ncbi:MAG: DUF898 family protein [Hyphomicrobiaceae bacterium]|nr:DUF898 family protein [Hyphomicrobiaceae bacterium]
MDRFHSVPITTGANPGREALAISWLKPFGMLGLSLYNFVMRILTLGIYHFWGKTEVRRRVWSAIRVNGEPLEYTGTGRELFLGFLLILWGVLVPVMLLSLGMALLLGPGTTAFGAFQVLLYAGFMLLTGIAIHRAQRFRLSRTRWRGIRAGLDGSSWTYGWTYFWTLLTLPLTLGWSAPWRSTKLQRLMTRDMRFGTQHFTFSASSKPLYKPFALYWVAMAAAAIGFLAIVAGSGAAYSTLMQAKIDENGGNPVDLDTAEIAGLVLTIYLALFVGGLLYVVLSAWYRAATMRHFARHTHLEGAGFESTVSARGLLWIALTNYAILIFGATLVTLVAGGAAYAALPLLADPAMAGLDEENFGRAASAISVILGFVLVLSLGMLLPITQARSTGYLIRNLSVIGSLDMASIAAGAEPTSKRGEGLAQAFDIDAL